MGPSGMNIGVGEGWRKIAMIVGIAELKKKDLPQISLMIADKKGVI